MISSFIHHNNNKIHWFHHVWIKYIIVYWIEITSHKISYDSHLQSKHVWYILPMQKMLQRFRIKCNFEAFESKAKMQRQMYWIRYTLISTLMQKDLYLMRWDVFIRYKNIISSHMKCMLVVVVIHAAPNILYMLTLQMAESHFRLVFLDLYIHTKFESFSNFIPSSHFEWICRTVTCRVHHYISVYQPRYDPFSNVRLSIIWKRTFQKHYMGWILLIWNKQTDQTCLPIWILISLT